MANGGLLRGEGWLGGCPDGDSRGVGRQGVEKARRPGGGAGAVRLPGGSEGQVDVRGLRAGKGEEGSGEKGEEALQKRE